MTWFVAVLRRLLPRSHERQRTVAALLEAKIARARAEAAEQRVAFLAEASRVLSSSLEYEATLSSVSRLAVPHLADWCAVDIVQSDGAVHRVAVAHVDPSKVKVALDLNRRYPVVADAPYGVARVLRTGRPELYPKVTDDMLVAVARDAAHLETLRRAGLRSGMCVPMSARGRTLGAIAFGSTRPARRYGAEDLALAEELAQRAALAVDNARLYDELRHREGRETETALRSVSALAAAAAHEINNPLSVVMAQTSVLAREVGVPGRRHIEAIRAATARIAQIVTDMGHIVRLEQVPSRPHLPDMLDLRRSTSDATADPANGGAPGA